MHKIKKCHTYAIPHRVTLNKVVEVIASDGLPAQSYEPVNKLTHEALETPPASVFSLEAQIASNQPIRRINTLTMEPDELSCNQIAQLDSMNEDFKQEQILKAEEAKKSQQS